MEKSKFCLHCSMRVDNDDHRVQLSTFNRHKGLKRLPDEHIHFHMQCWSDYFNLKVNEKVRNQVKFLQSRAMEVFSDPRIRNLLSQIGGTDTVYNMLNTDLNQKTISKEDIINKIHGKRTSTPDANSADSRGNAGSTESTRSTASTTRTTTSTTTSGSTKGKTNKR